MKIAFFHNLPTGGHKRAAFEQAKGLSARGHRVHEYTLSTTDNKVWDISQVTSKSYVYDYESLEFKLTGSGLIKLEEKIAEDIDGRAYDVCLVQPCLVEQTPSLLEFLKTPSLYYCPEPQRVLFEPYLRRQLLGSGELKKPFWKIDQLWEYRIWQKGQSEAKKARAADLILTNSYFSREVLYRSYGVQAQVNYLGVDTNVFRPASGIKKENAILHVGTSFIKQPEFTIEALSRIPEKVRPLLWFRSQPDQGTIDKLTRLGQKMGVAVKFLGEVDDEGLVKVYNRAKITLCPSLMEPFGLTAIESMACATPVVAVKEGGYRESVQDKETGYLLDRDPQEFADAVIALLKDDQKYAQFSQAAYHYIQSSWGWEKSLIQLECYLNCLQHG